MENQNVETVVNQNVTRKKGRKGELKAPSKSLALSYIGRKARNIVEPGEYKVGDIIDKLPDTPKINVRRWIDEGTIADTDSVKVKPKKVVAQPDNVQS